MSLYGVTGYHVTLSEGHMIDNPPYEETLVPHLILSQIYSYYIRGDRSPLIWPNQGADLEGGGGAGGARQPVFAPISLKSLPNWPKYA